MSYVPHTPADRAEMLARIGAPNIGALFAAIPADYRFPQVELPAPLSEPEVLAELRELAERNLDAQHAACFLGAGAYHHFVPSVVGHIIGRSEFYTAYTPYQPEVSQGTLQAIFEYQSMICDLTGMEVANASHYDGATALAEAVIMAASVQRGKRKQVVVSRAVQPEWRAVMRTYTQAMGLEFVGEDEPSGTPEALAARIDDQTACVIVQYPDFLGRVYDLSALAQATHAHKALLVVGCQPIALGMLQTPGAMGADIVFGEGQPLGNPLSFGGPYLGFYACREEHVRRMAGRLAGETVDGQGRRGYVLTLATREQHIRRERATSNICTNQGLNALAAAVYLAALGRCGLSQVAQLCYHKAHYAAEAIAVLPGYAVERAAPFWNEFVVHCPDSAHAINERLLRKHRILGGYDLSRAYPDRQEQMLLCVTELNTRTQIDALVAALGEVAR